MDTIINAYVAVTAIAAIAVAALGVLAARRHPVAGPALPPAQEMRKAA